MLPTLANAADLTQWANRLDAQGLLPKLIRRLIRSPQFTLTASQIIAKSRSSTASLGLTGQGTCSASRPACRELG